MQRAALTCNVLHCKGILGRFSKQARGHFRGTATCAYNAAMKDQDKGEPLKPTSDHGGNYDDDEQAASEKQAVNDDLEQIEIAAEQAKRHFRA